MWPFNLFVSSPQRSDATLVSNPLPEASPVERAVAAATHYLSPTEAGRVGPILSAQWSSTAAPLTPGKARLLGAMLLIEQPENPVLLLERFDRPPFSVIPEEQCERTADTLQKVAHFVWCHDFKEHPEFVSWLSLLVSRLTEEQDVALRQSVDAGRAMQPVLKLASQARNLESLTVEGRNVFLIPDAYDLRDEMFGDLRYLRAALAVSDGLRSSTFPPSGVARFEQWVAQTLDKVSPIDLEHFTGIISPLVRALEILQNSNALNGAESERAEVLLGLLPNISPLRLAEAARLTLDLWQVSQPETVTDFLSALLARDPQSIVRMYQELDSRQIFVSPQPRNSRIVEHSVFDQAVETCRNSPGWLAREATERQTLYRSLHSLIGKEAAPLAHLSANLFRDIFVNVRDTSELLSVLSAMALMTPEPQYRPQVDSFARALLTARAMAAPFASGSVTEDIAFRRSVRQAVFRFLVEHAGHWSEVFRELDPGERIRYEDWNAQDLHDESSDNPLLGRFRRLIACHASTVTADENSLGDWFEAASLQLGDPFHRFGQLMDAFKAAEKSALLMWEALPPSAHEALISGRRLEEGLTALMSLTIGARRSALHFMHMPDVNGPRDGLLYSVDKLLNLSSVLGLEPIAVRELLRNALAEDRSSAAMKLLTRRLAYGESLDGMNIANESDDEFEVFETEEASGVSADMAALLWEFGESAAEFGSFDSISSNFDTGIDELNSPAQLETLGRSFEIWRRGLAISDGFHGFRYEAKSLSRDRPSLLVQFCNAFSPVVTPVRTPHRDIFPGPGVISEGLHLEKIFVASDDPRGIWRPYEDAWNLPRGTMRQRAESTQIDLRGAIALVPPRTREFMLNGDHYSLIIYNEHFGNPSRFIAAGVATDVLMPEVAALRSDQPERSRLDFYWLRYLSQRARRNFLEFCSPSTYGGMMNAYPPGSAPHFEWERGMYETRDSFGHVHKSHRLGGWQQYLDERLKQALEPLKKADIEVYLLAKRLFQVHDVGLLARATFSRGEESRGRSRFSATAAELDDAEGIMPRSAFRMCREAYRARRDCRERGVAKEDYPVLVVGPALEPGARVPSPWTFDTFDMVLRGADGAEIEFPKRGPQKFEQARDLWSIYARPHFALRYDLAVRLMHRNDIAPAAEPLPPFPDSLFMD